MSCIDDAFVRPLDPAVVSEVAWLWAEGASEPLSETIKRVAEEKTAAEEALRKCNEAMATAAELKQHRELGFSTEFEEVRQKVERCADLSSLQIIELLSATSKLLKRTGAFSGSICWKEHRGTSQLLIPLLNVTVLRVRILCAAIVYPKAADATESSSALLSRVLCALSELHASASVMEGLDEPVSSLFEAVGSTVSDEILLKRLCYHFTAGSPTLSLQHPQHYFSFIISVWNDAMMRLLLPSKDTKQGTATVLCVLRSPLLIGLLRYCCTSINAHFVSLFLSAPPAALSDAEFVHLVNCVLRFAGNYRESVLSVLPLKCNEIDTFTDFTPCLSGLFCREGPLRSRWIHLEGKYMNSTVTSNCALHFPRSTVGSCTEWRTVWLHEALREASARGDEGTEELPPLVSPTAMSTARCIAAFFSRHRPLLAAATARSPPSNLASTAGLLLKATLAPALRAWRDVLEAECEAVTAAAACTEGVMQRGCLLFATAQYLAEHARSWIDACEGPAHASILSPEAASSCDVFQLCADRTLRYLAASNEPVALQRTLGVAP